jgi:hypothetical protein
MNINIERKLEHSFDMKFNKGIKTELNTLLAYWYIFSYGNM